jgi:hypothetical protein
MQLRGLRLQEFRLSAEENRMTPNAHVILSEVKTSRSEVFTQSKDPYHACRAKTVSGNSPRDPAHENQ